MRYFLSISYNGAPFCGWQIQDNASSVQQTLQDALSTLFHEEIKVTGAGRTDTAVNAINYIAHFDTSEPLQMEPAYICYKLNAILPKSIAINNIAQVADDAHARFDAIERCYRYYIHLGKEPFLEEFSYQIHARELDIDAMNRAAEHFLGQQDFSSLEKLRGGNTNSICNVTYAKWHKIEPLFHISQTETISGTAQAGSQLTRASSTETISCNAISSGAYYFEVRANRFLRNMVRAMVGSLLEVGTGKHSPEWIAEMLSAHNRCAAGTSVPGNALFLCEIKYPYKIF